MQYKALFAIFIASTMFFVDQSCGMDSPAVLAEEQEAEVLAESKQHSDPVIDNDNNNNNVVLQEGQVESARRVHFDEPSITPGNVRASHILDSHYNWIPQEPSQLLKMEREGRYERYVS